MAYRRRRVNYTRYPEASPDSLFEQCITFVVKHLEVLAAPNFDKLLELKAGVSLPTIVCERLLDAYQEKGFSVDEKFCSLFQNPELTQMRRIRLRSPRITDEGFRMLVNSNPTEVEIWSCPRLSEKSLYHLNQKSEQLTVFCLEAPANFFPDTIIDDNKSRGLRTYEKFGYILNAPNLKKLVLKRVYLPDPWLYFPLFFKPLRKLTYLDLSSCYDISDISHLTDLDNLTTLILFNVKDVQKPNIFNDILKIKTLKHLDISQVVESQGTFTNPVQTMQTLIDSLPNLVSLDISGTNLAATEHKSSRFNRPGSYVPKDIPGLRSRVDNPLEFLGLYKAHFEGCRYPSLPAKKVSGDAYEHQILTALQAYIDRKEILPSVLNDLYNMFRYERIDKVEDTLKLLLKAMDRHLHEKQVQISGSAIMFYIAKLIASKPCCSIKLKRHLISTLINSMGAFQSDETVMRNVCLTLIQFNVPTDVLFEYERLVLLLLYVVSEVENESFIQRIGVYLLNSLACHLDDPQKQLLGNLGTINRMMSLISDRLHRRVCDDVLEVAWSTMWNITDETFENCSRFLAENGMDLFLSCLTTFPNREELLRNMMGLLGNVAEMKSLRPFLMSERFVPVFTELLGSCCDGIEVSYNAAGVLVHMCSDGPEAWTVKEPKREAVLKKIVWAIKKWNVGTERNINYRSFQPILGLLKVKHTEECRLWAVWALANLTTVYPDKYCALVVKEGGIELLEEVLQTRQSHKSIKKWASIVIKNCLAR